MSAISSYLVVSLSNIRDEYPFMLSCLLRSSIPFSCIPFSLKLKSDLDHQCCIILAFLEFHS